MKQKDIAIIIAVAGVAALLAVGMSRIVIRSGDKKQQAEVVQAITPEFNDPDARFFNANSIDPTLQIQIGGNANNDPFKGNN